MRKGFTLIEMLIAITLVSVMMAIAIPFMKVSTSRRVRTQASQLARDLELARTRAMSTRNNARLVFDESGKFYVGYSDHDRDDVILETEVETQALRGFGRRDLSPDVNFGRGSAGAVPGDTGSGGVTFLLSRVEFNGRGVTIPFGTRGAVYFTHRDDPEAAAAVTVTGSGTVKLWVYRGGVWQ
jgi:prepilin-type N-terminal cleavage/methylation domain-containing protein